jgi:hypothetical protein
MNGLAVSDVKNGDVGLCGPGEKDDGGAPVAKELASESLLNEWYGLWPWVKSMMPSGLSSLTSSDLVMLIAVGERSFEIWGGEVGEMLLGL